MTQGASCDVADSQLSRTSQPSRSVAKLRQKIAQAEAEAAAEKMTQEASGDIKDVTLKPKDEFPAVLCVDIEAGEGGEFMEIEAATDGEYHRIAEVGPDGLPIWKKEGGDTWLFSGVHGSHAGFWCVGDDTFKNAQFCHEREGSAYVSSCAPHEGLPPQKFMAWYSCGMYCAVSVTEVGNEAFFPGDLVKVIEEGFDKTVGGYQRRGTLGKLGDVVEMRKDTRPYKVKLLSDDNKICYPCYEAAWLQKVNSVYKVFGTLRWDEHHVIHWDTAEDCVKWWDDATQTWQNFDGGTKEVFDSFHEATPAQISKKTGSPGLLESTSTCF